MSNITTIGNFSVESVSFEVPQNSTISSVQPTAVLTLIPNMGYVIDANDFSYVSGPSQITGAVFTQSGDNVICTVTFDANYVMPGNDVDLPICIAGNATLLQYNLSGTIELIAGANITPVAGNTSYSASGDNGETVQAFTFTVSADSGYFFETDPQSAITAGITSDYNVTSSNVYDQDGNLTSVDFTADYTFRSGDVTGNIFTIIANVEAIPVLIREITAYTIDTSNLPGSYNTTRNMKVYGTPGALFSLTAVNEDGTSILGSTLSNVVIPQSGVYSFNITFPSVADNDHYDFVITGDLADSFDTPAGQPSTFTINQYLDITVAYGLTSTNTSFTLPSNVSYAYSPLEQLETGDSNYTFQVVFDVTSAADITLENPILPSDFSNTDPLNNGGTDINIESVVTSVSTNLRTLTIVLDGFVLETGTEDVLSQINLDNFVSTNRIPTAFNVSKIITEDENDPNNLIIQLLGNDLDGDSLLYEILNLPANGDLYNVSDTTFQTPLSIGQLATNISSILYKPDADYDGVDSFDYKVNDGQVDSNNAAVSITVTPVNEAPIFTSTPASYTGTQGGTYVYNFTYEDVDNTDPEVTITTQSTLPTGWALTDNDDGTGVLTGPVPAGSTTIVIIATDPEGLIDTQTINVSAAYDILGDMEFLVSYRSGTITSETGQSPKTSGAITISGEPNGLGGLHTCARADFVLAAESQNAAGETTRYRIGAVNLNNSGTYNQYKLKPSEESNRPDGITFGTSVSAAYLDLTDAGESLSIGNIPVSAYNVSEPRSYYVGGTIGNTDRHVYLEIPQSVIEDMTNPITGTATGVFVLKLLPDSYDLLDENGNVTTDRTLAVTGRLDSHGDAAWLQVFKRNDADTNQEEILDSGGNSFSVVSASNIAINIFTGEVTVS